MHSFMKRTRNLLLAGVLLTGAAAHATFIDFRDAAYSAADYQPSYTALVEGVELTLKAYPVGRTLYQDDKDGIGIRGGYENDEIEGDEVLALHFSRPVLINYLHVSDLFYEKNSGVWFQEIGYYWMDDGDRIQFIADKANLPSPATNGEQMVNVGKLTDVLYLGAPGKIQVGNYLLGHEFSLAGVDITVDETQPIPEPSTLAMFGLGLLGFGFYMRRRKN